MMWIIFGFMLIILGFILVIIYLLNKLDELKMYKTDHEVRELMDRIHNQKVSPDAKNYICLQCI